MAGRLHGGPHFECSSQQPGVRFGMLALTLSPPLQVPAMAAHPLGAPKRMGSKSFMRILDQYSKQVRPMTLPRPPLPLPPRGTAAGSGRAASCLRLF
jgi:hypothetical protein